MRWVSELLDINGCDWDFEKLIGYFNSADADAIAKIKLPAGQSEDFIARNLEKTGQISIRSAYSLAVNLQRHEHQSSSNSAPDGDRKLWSNIWQGGVPPKVNVFVWKLCRDKLPTRNNKLARNLKIGASCLLCDRD